MGIFSKRKDKDENNSDMTKEIKRFLEEADSLYIQAYETRSIGILKDYFTRDCCISLSSVIAASASSRYFSVSKFRNTTWSILKSLENSIIVKKTVIYNDIKVAGSYKMKVSNDYKEEWHLCREDGELMVVRVASILE